MQTLKSFLVLLLCLAPCSVFGQSANEFNANLKTGLLFNKDDIHREGGANFVDIKNTLHQSVGGNYTRVTKKGFLLSGGINLGYEWYEANVNYPFNEYGFFPPKILGEQYRFYAVITYADLEANVGYRLKPKGLFTPELRLGGLYHVYLSSKQYDVQASIEKSYIGYMSMNMERYGFFGNLDPKVSGRTLLTYIYLGTGISSKSKKIKRYNIGLQIQRKVESMSQNYFEVKYYNHIDLVQSREVFRGMATTVNLVLGMTF